MSLYQPRMRDSYTEGNEEEYPYQANYVNGQSSNNPSTVYQSSYQQPTTGKTYTAQQPAIRTVTNILGGQPSYTTSQYPHTEYRTTSANQVVTHNIRTGSPARQSTLTTTQYFGQPTTTTTYNTGWQQVEGGTTSITRTSQFGGAG